LGKSAKLELIRRLVPLILGVLGIVGAMTFVSLVIGFLCIAAAIGVYAALPHPKVPTGAVKPDPKPPVIVTDLVGFTIGIPLYSLSLVGAGIASGAAVPFLLALLLPASLCIPVFMIAVRQETSWMRFFDNGFEFAQLGMRARVPYFDLQSVRVRVWHAPGGIGWLLTWLGTQNRNKVALLSGSEQTKTLVFTRKDGSEFAVSSEIIPDLQRILVGMDRAGIDLPEGLSQWQLKRIKRVRERLYGRKPEPQTEQLDVARIAATVRKFQQQRT
jgi:hypothetical protein